MRIKPYPGPLAPQVEKIWVIVPFRRVEHFDRMIENFGRQRFPGKRLLIVENGPAVGYCLPRLEKGSAVILTSGEHQSLAKNEAVRWIRSHDGGFFATMDDDDWYGPGYLDEIAGYAKDYDVLGKQWHFVSLGEGTPDPALLLLNSRYADQDGSWFTGGSISGWSETATEFPLTEAEDVSWCERMRSAGARLRSLSVYHYLYRRSYAGAAHAWGASRDTFERAVTGSTALEFPVSEGEIDLDLVTGERAPTEYRLLGQERFIPVDSRELSLVHSRR